MSTIRSELVNFRQWVHGLSHEDLLRAMEFEIMDEEYEMFKLQVPPPTPIHHGILGYRPASSTGATDGRNEQDRIYKARFQKPRLFQFILIDTVVTRRNGFTRRRTIMPSPSKRVDVIARRKITPWGDVLSIGCTQEQRDADAGLLKGTRITIDKNRKVCFFCSPDGDSILRVLHVVSRGKFLSVRQSTSPFCATWMHVFDEWFSLPMYLASRFEVALWKSFRHRGEEDVVSTWSDSIRGAIGKLNASAFQNALLSAAATALGREIFSSDGALRSIRDGVMFDLLDTKRSSDDNVDYQIADTLTKVGTVPLVYLDSSRHKFQTALWNQLQEAIAIESEKEMLRSLENEANLSSHVDTHKFKKSKGRKKKKRRRNKESKAESTADGTDAEHNTGAERGNESKSEVQMPLVDPKSIEKARENTRKVIMAGTIIDHVLDGVFTQLGLNTPPLPPPPPPAPPPRKKDEQVDPERSETASIGTKALTSDAQMNGSKWTKSPNDPSLSCVAFDHRKVSYTAETDAVAPSIHIEDNKIFPKLPEPSGTIGNEETASQPRIPTAKESHRGNDFRLESEFFSVPWISDEQTVDGWEKLKRYPNRERSLLADLFLNQKKDGDNDAHVASSTAASIASSSDKGSESGDTDSITCDQSEPANDGLRSAPSTPIAPVLEEAVLEAVAASMSDAVADDVPLQFAQSNSIEEDDEEEEDADKSGQDISAEDADRRSPSPLAPKTPPPQLSPILVSLADLQTIRTRAAPESLESPKAMSHSAVTAESLPSSPMPASTITLTPSWSREDLRISTFTDDQRLYSRTRGFALKKRASAPLSYRNVAVKSLPKANMSLEAGRKSSFVEFISREDRSGGRSAVSIPDLRPSAFSRNDSDACAQSETAVEALSYDVPLNDTMRPTTRDHTEVTISTKDDSPPKSPPRGDALTEELAVLRDERNAFRDMCLTLGAEVSKLKNLLAAQSGASSYERSAVGTMSSAYDPVFMPAYFSGVAKATTTVGAMSDGGTHRGDHDSAFSEDGTDGLGHESSGRPHSVHVRRMSSSATIAGSDLSVEQNVSGQAMLGTSSFRSLNREVLGSISGHGFASRLTKDILSFLRAKNVALRIQDQKKKAAIERLTRLVTALWPRAQVKIYGSHVTGLCLPSSDLDFVICLPAVHKNALAVAPGALEGRNAINESSQKTLARMLKGESWIDVRSIKIIARTVVPVIKVSTKDTRAHTIQLDISFDGPEHHGLAANQMILEVVQELPMVQPLVLVLKQFLRDRSLLTAYTGGLSSYALFLMVTRYLQEYPTSWGDCGSLLMGFLDFYGNSFDPRATGISVARRQYFVRMKYAQPQPMWNTGFPQHLASSSSSSVGGRPDLVRRNSFNENATMDGPRLPRPPRFQPPSHHHISHQYKLPTEQAAQATYDQSGRPYTFDPLFIEDPLSEGNNVGRNAFRIFQVQRAFSDAHRALVASLEWDIHSSQDARDGGDYPLLNCLLQSEDVFYELDDTR